MRLMRAVQVMDIPMLKDFINALVMDSLTYGKLGVRSDKGLTLETLSL